MPGCGANQVQGVISVASGTESFVLRYGQRAIPVLLLRSRAARFRVTVFPDLRVVVSAPVKADTPAIVSRTRRRLRWIVRQLDVFARYQPLQPPRSYVSGETHYLMGHAFRLRIEKAKHYRVAFAGGYLVVQSRTPTLRGHVRKMVERWYLRMARRVFEARMEKCRKVFARDRLPPSRLRLRRMPRRWGSCTPTGTITLNPDLVKTPQPCIDYAIIHELCHLIHPDHGRKFYDLLLRCIPDWRARKENLEMFAASAGASFPGEYLS